MDNPEINRISSKILIKIAKAHVIPPRMRNLDLKYRNLSPSHQN